jgi:hypothetical protein
MMLDLLEIFVVPEHDRDNARKGPFRHKKVGGFSRTMLLILNSLCPAPLWDFAPSPEQEV